MIRNHRHWNEDDWDSVSDQSALPLDVLDRENAYLSKVADNGDTSGIADYFRNVTISEKQEEKNLAGLAARVAAVEGAAGSLTEAKRNFNQLESRVGEASKTVTNLEGRVTALDNAETGKVTKIAQDARQATERVVDLSGQVSNIVSPGGVLDQKGEQILRATGELVNAETGQRIEGDKRVEGMIPKPEDIDQRIDSFIRKPEVESRLVNIVIADPNKGLAAMIREHAERAAKSITESESYLEATRDLSTRLRELVEKEGSPLWSLQKEINQQNDLINRKQNETLRIIENALMDQARYTTDFVFVPGGITYQDDFIKVESKGFNSVITALGNWIGELVIFANNEVNVSESQIIRTRASITIPRRFRVLGSERTWTTNLYGLNATHNGRVAPGNTDTIVLYKIYRGTPKRVVISGGPVNLSDEQWTTNHTWIAPVNATPVFHFKVDWDRVADSGRFGIRILIDGVEHYRVGPHPMGGLFSDTGGTQEILNQDITVAKGQRVEFQSYVSTFFEHHRKINSISGGILYVE